MRKLPKILKDNLRKDLKKLGSGKMTSKELNVLIARVGLNDKIKRLLRNLLIWVKETYMDSSFINHTVPPGVRAFIKCIASKSPVCSYIPWTLENMNLLDDLFTNIREDDEKVIKLHENLPVFFNLLIAVDGKLPQIFKAIILHLKDIAGKPFHSCVPQKSPVAVDGLSWWVIYLISLDTFFSSANGSS